MIRLGLAALAVTAVQLRVARFGALVVFTALLFALSMGLLQARKQARRDETDAALEADFLRLERELLEHQGAREPGSDDEAGS